MFGIVGCSSPSFHFTDPSKYDRFTLCDSYSTFLREKLSISDAGSEDPIGTGENRTVGWSTICQGHHAGGKLIGMLQVHNPRTDDAVEIPSDYQPLAGFEGKARMGAPLPYWTEIHVQDGTWSAEMSFVKESPGQELLGHDQQQEVARFLIQVAHDLQH
ncbi:hypothetical protein [Nocardia tengchongensis]|uniref:hypothetical protein n=1 Tax=Nocardia tengchongensis TaxID=2055889 RepID=UPI003607A24E